VNQDSHNPYDSTAYGPGQPGQNEQGNPYGQAGQNPYDQYAQTQQAGPAPAGGYPPSQYPPQNPNPYAPNPYQPGAAPNPYSYPGAPPQPTPTPPPYNQPGPASQPGAFAPYTQGGGAQPPPSLKPRSGNGRRIALIALLLIVILAAVVAAIAIPTHNAQVAHDNATATAQTASTASAHANATATFQANATATAIVSTYPFSANVKLNDPLADNSKGAGWRTDANCSFTGGAYHASESNSNTYFTCAALSSNYSNFTYQVTMQINKGANVAAGITFRGDDNAGKDYSFILDPTGGYSLFLYSSSTVKPATLQSGDASSVGFKTGVGQSNDIGVVARGSSISLYVNGQKLTAVTDSTYTSGQIGTVVYNIGDAVDSSFTNAKVWALS
jgi:Domain of Unknown Function (DUF1080)